MFSKIIERLYYKLDIFKENHKILAELKNVKFDDNNVKIVYYFKTKFCCSQHFYITQLASEALLFNEYEKNLLYKVKGAYEYLINTNELSKIEPFLHNINQEIINGR